ncbi:efflux transporter outer membrane subunit [Candidatus Protochlamydia phocaeensis]|uniref:efflux transporter outer membrane subunit n=1 Tax=Candidatus Protochlamydia phocaeensis TaxID=1414722 RepID=UPI000839611A|nr:efflux transporter outer membrane subunit [Candidatus Protochlamydia phocaeensis]
MPHKISYRDCLSIFGFSFLGSLAFVGCQLIPPYQGPCTPTPGEWKTPSLHSNMPSDWKSEMENSNQTNDHPHSDSASCNPEEQQQALFSECKENFENWWEVFNDPVLNQLEEQALNSSYTLKAALQRVIEARAQAWISRAALAPAINFAPSFSRSGSLIQNPIPGGLGTGTTGTQPTVQAGSSSSGAGGTAGSTSLPSEFRFVQSQYLLPLDLSYEVDLWSRLTNTYEAALIRAQASLEDYYSVLLTLTADVASHYFQMRDLDAQQVVLEKTIQARRRAYEINLARFKAGLIVYLDVSRAEVELARAESDSIDIRRQRGLEENMIASLVGVPAPVFSLDFNPLYTPPPLIPAGLPSDLLIRRPDIARAERNLAAAYADIAVAYTNFFPSINLTAAIGLESPFAHSLFSWKARFWEVGLNIMQTVFDAGRNEANLIYYKAKFRELLANYQEVVLTAFQDVEDSLTDIRERAFQSQALTVAVRAARETLNLSELRYNQGLVNYLDVVDAERTLLETEQNSVIVLGDRYLSTIRLIKSLGGGWGRITEAEECDACLIK